MGVTDKAKEAALQAKATAEQAALQAKATAGQVAQQGQAKIAAIKKARDETNLYRALGQAVYSEQRKGGDHAAVDTALAALDAHFASHATDATGAARPATDVPSAAASPSDAAPDDASPAAPPPADVPPGG